MSAIRLHEKNNNKINKYITENKENEKLLIKSAIKLAEDERNARDKYNMIKGRQVNIDETQTDTHENKTIILQRIKYMGGSFSTATHRLINSITCDGKHIHFRNIPNIATYHQHDKAKILT